MPEDEKFYLHLSGHGSGGRSVGKDLPSTVSDVHLVSDSETGRSRGFAFVTMGTPEEAAKAIEGMAVSTRTLKIKNFDVSFPVLQRGDPDVIVSVVFVDENGATRTARLDVQKAMFLDALPEPLNRARVNREGIARMIARKIWV